MKYFIILASGMADEPLEELDGRTPCEAARTPALDDLAQGGKTGSVALLPEDLPASEEVALLSGLGYDPHEHFTGEAGLAVAATGLHAVKGQSAFIHNFLTEADGVVMDHAAGQITPREAQSLLESLQAALKRSDVQFHVGRGFTGVTVMDLPVIPPPDCTPPEEALGAPFDRHLPRGEGSEPLCELIQRSREVFREHEINCVRADLGENPAHLLWPWGPGRSPKLPSFESLHGLRAAMVAATESARGLGALAGMAVPNVDGATGDFRTDYAAKGQQALKLIEDFDAVVLHIASPADASLKGNVQRKIDTIENIDGMIVAPLLEYVRKSARVRIMFLPTHQASTLRRERTRGVVPVAMYGLGLEPVRQAAYSEAAAEQGEIAVHQGYELLPYFLRV